ncbi:B12-binding domain-containing radical SAM protein [Leptospira sp. 96542]|nr:B12-binding domain-containing radical SAM protein [Leptospira sp. 96542]
MAKIQFLQLPVPPPSYFAATGNVPLAAASLASSLDQKTDPIHGITTTVISPEETDQMGDLDLIERISKEGPDFLGLSLYLWNTERSLYIANEVKKLSPKTTILIGGPEVNPDNPFVLNETGYDIAVSGEAEENFRSLMKSLLANKPLYGVKNVAVRGKDGNLGAFSEDSSANFALTDFPSPYLTGHLAVDPKRSTYLETVRGCKSQCTYCFYPKSSQTLRTLDIKETTKLIQTLKEKGARELVFLDPTFNHRPGFENFLDAIIDVNYDGQLSMFAELRSEGITPHLAKKLKKAGFNRIEIGLQSVNIETLKRVKRYGDPNKVVEVAKLLASEGMELLLDLIIGLPGDKPEDVERGIHFFLEHGLGEWVQAFPLSILPGTAMRKDAEREGLLYMPTPPYRIIRTPNFTEEELVESLYFAEDVLERRLDEFPRPFLCEGDKTKQDVIKVNLELDSDFDLQSSLRRNASRHHSIWFYEYTNSIRKSEVPNFIQQRIEREPFCTIDFVFPINVSLTKKDLGSLARAIEVEKRSYLSRSLAHRGENLQHRLVLIWEGSFETYQSFLNQYKEDVSFFIYYKLPVSQMHSIDFGLGGFYLLIGDDCDESDWDWLIETMDPETISFHNRKLEERWTLEVLGYGEM